RSGSFQPHAGCWRRTARPLGGTSRPSCPVRSVFRSLVLLWGWPLGVRRFPARGPILLCWNHLNPRQGLADGYGTDAPDWVASGVGAVSLGRRNEWGRVSSRRPGVSRPGLLLDVLYDGVSGYASR